MVNQKQPTLNLAKTINRGHDVVVIGLTTAGNGHALVGATAELDKAVLKKHSQNLLELAIDLGAKAEPDCVVVLPKLNHRLVVVGLGDPDVDPKHIRKAVSNACRKIASLPGDGPLNVAISLELSDPELLQAAGEAAILGQYSIAKITAEPKPVRISNFDLISPNSKSEAKDAVSRAKVTADAVCVARDLINQPPNLLYPDSFANFAKNLVRDAKISVTVLDEKDLAKGGYGGLIAVGGGSSRKPRLVRLEYAPRGAKTKLNLVGKGITFDSGGIDLKSAAAMLTMKCDMSGAAAVVAAVHAIAKLGLKINVTAYAALAENLPSDTAYRPSDVLTMYGGKTVENVNTDAEGRLVLADALERSNEDSPDLVVDVATLTGACVIALGNRCAGLMSSDVPTADLVLDAAEVAGEDFWHLPITDQARSELDSPIADMKSGSTTGKAGGALVAAAFLQRFVAENTSWAHLDIAGPAFNEGSAYDEAPAGGTGAAVRTLVSLASMMSK